MAPPIPTFPLKGGRSAPSLDLLPSPLEGVWTGEIGDRCSGTWVTHFRMPSKPSNHRILLLRWRRWGCGHRACDVHKSTGGDVASQVERADRLRAVMQAEHGVG